MKYYKVVNSLTSKANIDTKKTNYSSTLINLKTHEKFLNYITTSSRRLNLPLDIYLTINNNLALWGDIFLQNIPRSKNGIFEVANITNKKIHSNIFIKEFELIKIVENLIAIGITLFNEGYYLWEYIFENVRIEKFKTKPSRIKSFFLFENISDCNLYIKNHKLGGVVCEVKTKDLKSSFRGDMNLLDQMQTNLTCFQAENIAEKYWNNEVSTNPIFETLFQGNCELLPIAIA